MAVKFSNNASTTLSNAINNVVVALAISVGEADRFPVLGAGDWFPITVIDSAGNMEIMRCTQRVGTTLTVMRAQEGTTAKAFPAGSRVELRLTAAALAGLLEQLNAAYLVAGTVPAARLTGAYNISISGNAATATNATNATNAGDSARLGNQLPTFYTNLANATGTLAAARLTGTYNINISGNAATATNASSATNAANATHATNAGDADTVDGLHASSFPKMYYGDITTETNYPIGHCVMFGGYHGRNQAINLWYGTDANSYNYSGTGTALSGIWRARGSFTAPAVGLAQRVA